MGKWKFLAPLFLFEAVKEFYRRMWTWRSSRTGLLKWSGWLGFERVSSKSYFCVEIERLIWEKLLMTLKTSVRISFLSVPFIKAVNSIWRKCWKSQLCLVWSVQLYIVWDDTLCWRAPCTVRLGSQWLHPGLCLAVEEMWLSTWKNKKDKTSMW